VSESGLTNTLALVRWKDARFDQLPYMNLGTISICRYFRDFSTIALGLGLAYIFHWAFPDTSASLAPSVSGL